MIITKEHLLKTFMKNILTELYEQYELELDGDSDMSFDEWAWENLHSVGELFYQNVGEHYGDFDDALDEVVSDDY